MDDMDTQFDRQKEDMATNLKNLSDYDIKSIPSAKDMIFGIVTAEWNSDITNALLDGAIKTLLKHGAKEKNILRKYVPGTIELTLGAQFMAEYADLDAIICLGCVIKGETPHFDFVCQSAAYGITELNMDYNIPFIFGVLTTLGLKSGKPKHWILT